MVGIRIAAFFGAVLLSACGQTGPLVLADDNGNAKQSAPVGSVTDANTPPKASNNTTTTPAE